MKYIILFLTLLVSPVYSHEMTPTYPVFDQSYVSGLSKTSVKLFNRRDDVRFYKIDVYDKEWNKVQFATENRLVIVNYLETKTIDIYVRNRDRIKIEFICTESKLVKGEVKSTGVSSRICSRIKRD